MMNATSAAGRRCHNLVNWLSAGAGATCGTLTSGSSLDGVTKQRPHPGTTILFCAIKENP
ncbi:hypothetical protein CUJ91_01275 [Paraburkholderia graminis]|nr:hypothetical protein CUJ91_01275 [Paraburkholderia graminis]